MFSSKSRKISAVAIVIVIIVAAVGVWWATTPKAPVVEKPVNVRFLTTAVGSGWYLMGAALAEEMKKVLPAGSKVEIDPGGAAISNVILLHKGEGDVAFSFSPVGKWAWDGVKEAGFDEKMTNVRLLATGLDTYWVPFAVTKEFDKKYPIKYVSDIKEKKYPIRLTTWTKGGLGEYGCRLLLREHGITYADIESWGGKVFYLPAEPAADTIKTGKADAISLSWTPKHPTYTDMMITVDMKFLPLEEEVFKKLSDQHGFTRGVIRAGEFKGVDKDVTPVLGMTTNLLVKKDLPDAVVYAFTKVLCEKKDALIVAYKPMEVFKPETAWKEVGYPLHPGAEIYYKEKGYVK